MATTLSDFNGYEAVVLMKGKRDCTNCGGTGLTPWNSSAPCWVCLGEGVEEFEREVTLHDLAAMIQQINNESE